MLLSGMREAGRDKPAIVLKIAKDGTSVIPRGLQTELGLVMPLKMRVGSGTVSFQVSTLRLGVSSGLNVNSNSC